MEKPIPSYQRKWLLADRKKCYTFSAKDDNNKHSDYGSSWLTFVSNADRYNLQRGEDEFFVCCSCGVKSLQAAARDGQKPTDWRVACREAARRETPASGASTTRRMREVISGGGAGAGAVRSVLPALLCVAMRSDARRTRTERTSCTPAPRTADDRDWAW
ncbi:hypothetical protein ALC53_03543 [Atta colombica]|uniref:Uncharacterized protein n=1 Tax=Atta colombica TaxID=520822 RepID=A0A195BP32_9HYME|nr:hypothetical protein ALC53_03543 [Atta colombica]